MILGVICTAKPTELVMTILTSHVIAALVLLNWSFAFRAKFSICLLPLGIFFIFSRILCLPLLELLARSSVPLLATFHTEFFFTFIADHMRIFRISNHRISTTRSWTPAKVGFGFKGSQEEELLVFGEHLI